METKRIHLEWIIFAVGGALGVTLHRYDMAMSVKLLLISTCTLAAIAVLAILGEKKFSPSIKALPDNARDIRGLLNSEIAPGQARVIRTVAAVVLSLVMLVVGLAIGIVVAHTFRLTHPF